MLEVGNTHLTKPQERTHFALWAAMKSPLLIGCDLRDLASRGKNYTIDILKNDYLLKFNQDENNSAPAKPFKWNRKFNKLKPPQFWSGRFGNDVIVLLFNNNENPQDMGFQWRETPDLVPGQSYRVIDAWRNRTIGSYKDTLTIKSIAGWDTAVLVMKKTNG
jgi:alpha-galactosidase